MKYQIYTWIAVGTILIILFTGIWYARNSVFKFIYGDIIQEIIVETVREDALR